MIRDFLTLLAFFFAMLYLIPLLNLALTGEYMEF